MPLVGIRDVIWIHDDLIRPPGPKMVVCVCPALGIFLRINSAGWRPGSVSLTRVEHPFLQHDSHLECGRPFELDDYVLEQALAKSNGIIGQLSLDAVPEVLAALTASAVLSANDVAQICAALLAG